MSDSGIRTGVTKLSQLEIDASKSWGGKKIQSIGVPDTDNGVPRRDTIDTKIATHATITPSDAMFHGNDPQKQSSSTPWVKHKEIVIAQGGTIRIKYDLRGQSEKVYGRIRRNGVEVGTEYTRTTSWGTKTEDIGGWSPGDLLQLYARSHYADWIVYTRNLRLYGDNAAGACNTLGYTEA